MRIWIVDSEESTNHHVAVPTKREALEIARAEATPPTPDYWEDEDFEEHDGDEGHAEFSCVELYPWSRVTACDLFNQVSYCRRTISKFRVTATRRGRRVVYRVTELPSEEQ